MITTSYWSPLSDKYLMSYDFSKVANYIVKNNDNPDNP